MRVNAMESQVHRVRKLVMGVTGHSSNFKNDWLSKSREVRPDGKASGVVLTRYARQRSAQAGASAYSRARGVR